MAAVAGPAADEEMTINAVKATNQGGQSSVSNINTLASIDISVRTIGLKGIKELTDITGPTRSVTNEIERAIKVWDTNMTTDTAYARDYAVALSNKAKLVAPVDIEVANAAVAAPAPPIVLMIKYPRRLLERRDPRNFAIGDYVIVFTNNKATATNASAVSGIYEVTDINHADDTVTVKPGPIPTSPLNPPVIPTNKCALLRKYNGRIIILCIDDNPSGRSSIGGAKSSRRRKRRPSRSKSVNKKRKYTQQRVRRRSHRR
jgi:hypothetical protein